MFEFKILLINILLPSAIALVAIWVVRSLTKRGAPEPHTTEAVEHPPQRPPSLALAVVVSATVLAIWSAFALRNEFAVWHEDAWMRLPLGTAIVGLASVISIWIRNWWAVNLLRLLALWAAAYLIFPHGEAWDFLLPSRGYWIVTVSGSCWVAWILVARRSSREAGVLGLGWIVLFAAAAFLTAQSFLKVTEPLLAISSVLGCLSLASFLAKSARLVTVAAGPTLFALSGAVASAQFNSFLGLPDALSWLAMSSPAMAACLSLPFTTKPEMNSKPSRAYIAACLISCVVLAVIVIAWTGSLTLDASGEEW